MVVSRILGAVETRQSDGSNPDATGSTCLVSYLVVNGDNMSSESATEAGAVQTVATLVAWCTVASQFPRIAQLRGRSGVESWKTAAGMNCRLSVGKHQTTHHG